MRGAQSAGTLPATVQRFAAPEGRDNRIALPPRSAEAAARLRSRNTFTAVNSDACAKRGSRIHGRHTRPRTSVRSAVVSTLANSDQVSKLVNKQQNRCSPHRSEEEAPGQFTRRVYASISGGSVPCTTQYG